MSNKLVLLVQLVLRFTGRAPHLYTIFRRHLKTISIPVNVINTYTKMIYIFTCKNIIIYYYYTQKRMKIEAKSMKVITILIFYNKYTRLQASISTPTSSLFSMFLDVKGVRHKNEIWFKLRFDFYWWISHNRRSIFHQIVHQKQIVVLL